VRRNQWAKERRLQTLVLTEKLLLISPSRAKLASIYPRENSIDGWDAREPVRGASRPHALKTRCSFK